MELAKQKESMMDSAQQSTNWVLGGLDCLCEHKVLHWVFISSSLVSCFS